jgi:hypothetical protein
LAHRVLDLGDAVRGCPELLQLLLGTGSGDADRVLDSARGLAFRGELPFDMNLDGRKSDPSSARLAIQVVRTNAS